MHFEQFEATGYAGCNIQSAALSWEISDALLLNELHLVYQPIFKIGSRKMLGVEALVRWRRNGVDVMTAGHFISHAEKDGQIIDIGKFALRTACKQLSKWDRTMARDLYVSVNVSPRQLLSTGFEQNVFQCLDDFDIPAHKLVLELTEREPFPDHDGLLSSVVSSDVISTLRERGVKVLLDDFCNSYMTFSQLLHYEVDGIKLSPEMAWGTGLQPEADRAWQVIRAIGEMCERMGISLVVEQVETLGQMALLEAFPNACAQGYLLKQPVEASQLLELLEQAQ